MADLEDPPPSPSPSPPLPTSILSIPGLPNLRDVGGWAVVTSDATNTNPATAVQVGHVRRGILYRSGDVVSITAAGIATLQTTLHIRTILDIRSQQQIDRAGGVRELAGLERTWLPIFSSEEYTPEKAGARYRQYAGDGTEGIVQAFTDILTHGAYVFKAIVQHIIASHGPPPSPSPSLQPQPLATTPAAPSLSGACLVHCTTGNNRTGALIGALLSLLGVSASDIATEYALSEEGLVDTRPAAIARLAKNPVFAAAYGEEVRERAARMLGARRESMLAMLEMMEGRWGGAEGYAVEVCGVTIEEVERVRRVMVERG